MNKSKGPLVVITGPTASGKSALALEVAQKYNGELICADSRTVYKELNIGTAKPIKEEQALVKHHLLDVVSPGEPFSAAQFQKLAYKAIRHITDRGKLPILVGGTGLYVDSVIFDYQFGAPADPLERGRLEALSIEELKQRCEDNDIPLPMNTQNKRHLIRAIELGGLFDHPKKLRPNTIAVAFTTKKEELRSKITKRAHQMVAEGVLDEVRKVGQKYAWKGEALTGNIYRILRPVVEDNAPLGEALELLITSDMQLAKRQITWLKRNPYIIWGDKDQLKVAIEHFVQQNNLSKSMPVTPQSDTIATDKR